MPSFYPRDGILAQY